MSENQSEVSRLFFGIDAKINIAKDVFSLGYAHGWHLHEDFFYWQWEPIIFYFTLPVSEYIDINFSARPVLIAQEENNEFIYLTSGIGVGPDINKLAFRPEFGYLVSTDGGDNLFTFGIGVSINN